MQEKTIRVFLIDDHAVLREGCASALAGEAGITVVGEAGTAADALREILTSTPDVVLVDLNMPDRDGIELIGTLRAQLPSARLLVLTCYDDEFRVAEALRAGAHGYLLKTLRVTEVAEGIRLLAAGGTPLSPRIAGALVHAVRRSSGGEARAGLASLTLREQQVARLLAAGMPTREAAAQLTISPKTVETHRMRIYAKLGCKSAIELTRIAVRNGLIEA